MTPRLKGRRRQAELVIAEVAAWSSTEPGAVALALVGSYACGRPRIGSDVDLVLLTVEPERQRSGLEWLGSRAPGSTLIRTRCWGSVLERRARLSSGLLVELNIGRPDWAGLPLDPGTARVLRDGCRILYDPRQMLAAALVQLNATATPR